MHGTLVVYEDSEITMAKLAIGLGKGQYGGQTLSWWPIALSDRSAETYDGKKYSSRIRVPNLNPNSSF